MGRGGGGDMYHPNENNLGMNNQMNYQSMNSNGMNHNYNNSNVGFSTILNQSRKKGFNVLHSNKGQDHGVNLDVCFGKEDPTTFFNDGVRKIDFVLVVEENVKDFAESDGFGEGFNANENIDDSSK